MADLDAVFTEALEDINAGRARTMPDYLGLVPRSERAELAELLSMFFMHDAAATGPTHADAASYERALGVLDRLSGKSPAGNLPAALQELRRTRRLRREDVIQALAERFVITGQGRERLRRSYHELETGQLPGRGLSRRLLNALGEILRVDPDDLAAAALWQTVANPARPGQAFGRGAGQLEPVGGMRGKQPPREPSERLVEDLFCGGTDG